MTATIDTLLADIEGRIGPLPEALRDAFRAVDRTRFVRECDRAFAYENRPLPLDTPHGGQAPPVADLLARHGTWEAMLAANELSAAGSTISAPMIYAIAFLLLEVGPGARVLELGAGTGYGAALASALVGPEGSVTTVDVDPHLVEATRRNTAERGNVTVVHADGLACADLVATHTHAWLTFSVPERPQALVDALAESSVLLTPVGPPPPAPQQWLLSRREHGSITETTQPFPVMFIPVRPLVS